MVFGYTFCPDVCPTTLQHVAQALDLLGSEADRVQPLFVTIDPERDSPEVLAAYVGAFHPRMVGLTGTRDQIERITRNYRVYRAKAEAGDGDYLMDHSAFVYLLGSDGRLLTYLRHDASPESIAALIEPLLARKTQTASAP
jgi:protein SCO1/2